MDFWYDTWNSTNGRYLISGRYLWFNVHFRYRFIGGTRYKTYLLSRCKAICPKNMTLQSISILGSSKNDVFGSIFLGYLYDNFQIEGRLGMIMMIDSSTNLLWLVVYLPLWKIWVRQLGLLWVTIPNIWKVIKNVPNHQPVLLVKMCDNSYCSHH